MINASHTTSSDADEGIPANFSMIPVVDILGAIRSRYRFTSRTRLLTSYQEKTVTTYISQSIIYHLLPSFLIGISSQFTKQSTIWQ